MSGCYNKYKEDGPIKTWLVQSKFSPEETAKSAFQELIRA